MPREIPLHLYHEATELLMRAREFTLKTEIGVREATFIPQPEYPNLPIAFLHMTDPHYGSIWTDYELLDQAFKFVEDTPNTFMITNGDDVDNFNVIGKWATGTYENPLPPELQSRAYMERLEAIDKAGKLAVMSYGNHNEFGNLTGYDWFENFAKNLNAPVFTSGGYLHVVTGSAKEHYGIALTHRYWGTSKLNPTNAGKRFWEHEYPSADVVLLGHTHQSELLHWERGGKDRIISIGGTYKQEDRFARKMGIGGRGGQPGHVVMFWPNEHRMAGFKEFEVAQQFLTGMIFQEEAKTQVPK